MVFRLGQHHLGNFICLRLRQQCLRQLHFLPQEFIGEFFLTDKLF